MQHMAASVARVAALPFVRVYLGAQTLSREGRYAGYSYITIFGKSREDYFHGHNLQFLKYIGFANGTLLVNQSSYPSS